MRSLLRLIVALALVLPAPALPASPASTLRDEDLRVASVSWRIATRGAGLCAQSHPLTGLLLHHLIEYDGEGRVYQIARNALDRGPGILAVVADSPAARAGLIAGDTLLQVNGTAFPDPRLMDVGRRSGSWRAGIEGSEAVLEAALRAGPAELQILRGGRTLDLRLHAVPGCALRSRLAQSNQANAFSTGTHVVITSRMLAALRSDDELAIAIGHEFAHNLLGHPRNMRGARSRAAEADADRLGLRLARAAGYDIRAAVPMWRRLSAQFGSGLPIFRTHPNVKERERIIQEVIAEAPQPQPS